MMLSGNLQGCLQVCEIFIWIGVDRRTGGHSLILVGRVCPVRTSN